MRPPEPTAARPQLRALTGLRFFAALQVIVFHCTGWDSWTRHPFVRNVAGCGFVAVSLFFILSGFILTYAHAGPGARPLDRKGFYANRFARIYPAYAFALALIAPLFAGHTIRVEGTTRFLKAAVAVPMLLQAWVPSLAMEWNPPGWSLSAEVFFYALFPLVAAPLVACKRSTAYAVGVACYAFCLLAPIAYLAIAPDGPNQTYESTAFWLDVLRYNPAVRFPEFVIGIVVGRWYLERRPERISSGAVVFTSLASIALLVAALAFSPAIPYPILHNGLLAPVFAVLIASLAAGRGFVAKFLGTGALVALGDASYSLYVLHVPLLILWHKAILHLPGGEYRAGPGYTGAFVAFAVASSLACYRYVELPVRKVLLNVIRRTSAAPQPRNAPR